jgi:hypothetical protein
MGEHMTFQVSRLRGSVTARFLGTDMRLHMRIKVLTITS